MSDFTKHTRDTAPEESRGIMDQVEEKFGFVPNLIGHLAEAPRAAEAYVTLDGLFGDTSLSTPQQEVVRLVVSVENGCHYCVPAHTAGALHADLDREDVDALRDGRDPSDPELAALARFVRALVRNRGDVPDARLRELLDAGYGRDQVIEILVGVAQKTFDTEVDEPLSEFAWSGEAGPAAVAGASD